MRNAGQRFWWMPYVDYPAREKHKTHKKNRERSSYRPGKTDDFYILTWTSAGNDSRPWQPLSCARTDGFGGGSWCVVRFHIPARRPRATESHCVTVCAIEWPFEWHCTSVGVTWSRPGYADLLVNWLRSHAGTFNKLARSQCWHGRGAPSTPP